MRDIRQERGVEMQGVGGNQNRGGDVALDQAGRRHVLGQSVGPVHKLAVGVCGQHQDIGHIGINKTEPEEGCSLCFGRGPGGHAPSRGAGRTAEQLTGRDRLAISIVGVLADEYLPSSGHGKQSVCGGVGEVTTSVQVNSSDKKQVAPTCVPGKQTGDT